MNENIKQESLADVIAEGRGYKGIPVPYAPARAIWLDDFNSFLDRIEAAYKREIERLNSVIQAQRSAFDAEQDRRRRELEKLQREYDECARDYNNAQRARSIAESELRELKKSIGNMAKMREALVTLRENLHVEMINGCACGPTYIGPTVCASGLIDAALAEPPRNCDRFGSCAEAKAEWWKVEVLPRVDGVVSGAEPPFTDWLFAPAAERKGENHGSK